MQAATKHDLLKLSDPTRVTELAAGTSASILQPTTTTSNAKGKGAGAVGASKSAANKGSSKSVHVELGLGSPAKGGYRFGGAQTFTLRQLWPYKAYHFCLSRQRQQQKPVFKGQEAIIEMGVGANMVDSINYWARSLNIIDKNNEVTPFAVAIFGTELVDFDADPEHDQHIAAVQALAKLKANGNSSAAVISGFDPYLERTDTLWLLHYFLSCDSGNSTVLWYLFNRFNKSTFTKDEFLSEFDDFVHAEMEAGRMRTAPSANTINRDLDTALRTYAPLTRDVGVLRKEVKKLDNVEELSDNPMRELMLMSSSVQSSSFNRGTHSTLSSAAFAFCLHDYFIRVQDRLVTMDFNKIAYGEGSVGRVFKLDENSLTDYLLELDQLTNGVLRFTEQNGIRQLSCTCRSDEERQALLLRLLEQIYECN